MRSNIMFYFQYPGHKGDLTKILNDIPEYEDHDHKVVEVERHGERALAMVAGHAVVNEIEDPYLHILQEHQRIRTNATVSKDSEIVKIPK